MKAMVIAIVLCGCLDRPETGTATPEPWHPSMTIDCGALPSPPVWSATVDDTAGIARVPLDQWIGLATWIAAVEDWQSCMASSK